MVFKRVSLFRHFGSLETGSDFDDVVVKGVEVDNVCDVTGELEVLFELFCGLVTSTVSLRLVDNVSLGLWVYEGVSGILSVEMAFAVVEIVVSPSFVERLDHKDSRVLWNVVDVALSSGLSGSSVELP